MINHTCALCGCGDEEVMWGHEGLDLHRDCFYRAYGNWYQKAYQKVADFGNWVFYNYLAREDKHYFTKIRSSY